MRHGMTRKLTKSEAGALGGRANGSRTRQWVRIEAYRAIEQQLVQAREEIKELKRQDDFAEQMSELIVTRSEEHTSELQSQSNLVCRLLLEKKKKKTNVSAL